MQIVFKVSNDVRYAYLVTRRDVFAKQTMLGTTPRMSMRLRTRRGA